MKKKIQEPPIKNSFIDKWVENLELNSENVKKVLGDSADYVTREITVNSKHNVKVHMACIDGLINHQYISDYILKPLVNDVRLATVEDENTLFEYIEQGLIYFTDQKSFTEMGTLVDAVLSANTVLIFDGLNKAIGFDTKGFQMRSITTPTEETSIRGSKDTFVETIRVNTATIRRKIKSSNLRIEDMTIGSMSNTMVSVVYMENVVNKIMLKELKERLKKIDVEEVLFAGIIEESIIDEKHTTFPQVDYTEKPDKFCISISDGKIGLLIDGIPFSMIMPIALVDMFQTTDDYTINQFFTSSIRKIRYFLASVSLVLPGFFIAVATFHQQLLPSRLTVSIITSREGVPFPLFFEVLILVLAFQVLIEAGTRIYSSIGSMISLVGALVVGDAAIGAKFVSPAAVVVVATAAISNYAIPNRDLANALWIWELVLLMFSTFIGIFGLAIGLVLMIATLCSIEVLGVPYMSPFLDTNTFKGLKDSFIRPRLDKKESPDYIQRIK